MTMKEIIKWLAGIFPKPKNKNSKAENNIPQKGKLIKQHGNKIEFDI